MKRLMGSRLLAAFLSLAAVTAVFGGCSNPAGGSEAPSSGAESAAEPASSADAGEAVTLQAIMWGEQARWDAQKKVNEAFSAKYPNLKVNLLTVANQDDYWTKVQTMIAGGTAPDIAFQQEELTPSHVSKGFMEDLTGYMEKDTEFKKDWLAESNYGPFTVDGKIYAVPVMTFVDILFYNKTMFDAAKQPYPDDTWDWSKLREVAKKLTLDTNGDGKIDQYGYTFGAWPNFIYTYIWANGGDFVSEDRKTATLNSAQNVETFQFLHDLIWKDKVTPSAQINKDNMFSFSSGKVAMNSIGSWDVSTNDLNKINYGIALPPKAPTGNRGVNEYPNGWFIVKQSKNKDAAWKYLSFCASPDGQKISAQGKVGMPTNTEIAKSDAYLKSSTTAGVDLSVTVDALQIARGVHTTSNWSEISKNVWPEFDNIWTKSDADVKAVLDSIQPKLQAMLDKAQ